MSDVRMENITCSEDVMNELMEFTVESIGEEGLQQLRLKDFHAKIGLDLDTLVTLAHKA